MKTTYNRLWTEKHQLQTAYYLIVPKKYTSNELENTENTHYRKRNTVFTAGL